MIDKNEEDQEIKDKAFYESDSYFDLSEAATSLQRSVGVQEKASAFAKLAGKSIANAGIFAGKTGLFLGKEFISSTPDLAAQMVEKRLGKILEDNNHDMTDEHINFATEFIEKNKGRKLFGKSKIEENE